jgi:hypothetical protein
VYVFSAGYDKGNTRAPIVSFEAICYCLGSECRMKVLAFTIRAKSFIGIFDVGSIEQPPPYMPYTADEIGRNAVHEAKHRNHAREWHDANLLAIYASFRSAIVSCSECESALQERKQEWTNEYIDFLTFDGGHGGGDWTEADRTPTRGETNPDPATWVWIMPDRLNETWDYPY